MNSTLETSLRSRVKNLEAMPSMPVTLGPLLRCLELPPDQIEVEKVIELISCDESIAAQCLRMANSALFSRHTAIETIHGAVVSLGSRRLRDILWTTYFTRLAPKGNWPLDPMAFWEHSFGCALIAQQLAEKISLPEPEKIYLCGLLHDVGEVVNATLLHDEFKAAVEMAVGRGGTLFEAEKEAMGFTHCDTGKLLADYWNLSPDIQTVIEFHHAPEDAHGPLPLVGLVATVHLSDLLCRLRGMGYGYDELHELDIDRSPAWQLLAESAPRLRSLDIPRFVLDLNISAEDIRQFVATAFAS